MIAATATISPNNLHIRAFFFTFVHDHGYWFFHFAFSIHRLHFFGDVDCVWLVCDFDVITVNLSLLPTLCLLFLLALPKECRRYEVVLVTNLFWLLPSTSLLPLLLHLPVLLSFSIFHFLFCAIFFAFLISSIWLILLQVCRSALPYDLKIIFLYFRKLFWFSLAMYFSESMIRNALKGLYGNKRLKL